MIGDVEPGSSSPLGATPSRDGVHFSLFSRHATGVELCFFDRADDVDPSRVLRLDAATHRTYFYWHVFVPGVRPGQLYVILNAYWEPLELELPPPGDDTRGGWRRRIDTFLDSPHDIDEWQTAPVVPGNTYRAEAR